MTKTEIFHELTTKLKSSEVPQEENIKVLLTKQEMMSIVDNLVDVPNYELSDIVKEGKYFELKYKRI